MCRCKKSGTFAFHREFTKFRPGSSVELLICNPAGTLNASILVAEEGVGQGRPTPFHFFHVSLSTNVPCAISPSEQTTVHAPPLLLVQVYRVIPFRN